MTIEKRHLNLALLVLVLLVAWNLWRQLMGSSVPLPQQPLMAGVQPLGVVQAAAEQQIDPASIAPPPAVDVSRDPLWSRDPFLAPGESRTVARVAQQIPVGPDPVVNSILYSSGRKVALVDRHLVGVGDRVSTGTITEIQQDAIVIRTPSGETRRVALVRAGLLR